MIYCKNNFLKPVKNKHTTYRDLRSKIKDVILEIDQFHFDTNQLFTSETDKNNFIINLLLQNKHSTICEVGLGYGHLAIPLSKILKESKITAIESPFREYVKLPAYNKLIEINNINLHLVDISENGLPFNNDSFDVMILSEIIEHLSPTKLPDIFYEIRRCLRYNGVMIVATPNVHRLRNRLRFLLGKAIFESPLKVIGGTFGHIREYSHQELIRILHKCGFNQIQICRNSISYPIVETNFENFISFWGNFLSKFFYTFENSILITGIKND